MKSDEHNWFAKTVPSPFEKLINDRGNLFVINGEDFMANYLFLLTLIPLVLGTWVFFKSRKEALRFLNDAKDEIILFYSKSIFDPRKLVFAYWKGTFWVMNGKDATLSVLPLIFREF